MLAKIDGFFFTVEYYIVVGSLGFFKAFTSGNSVPLATELIGPDEAINLYVLKCLLDGLGTMGMPFLAGEYNSILLLL